MNTSMLTPSLLVLTGVPSAPSSPAFEAVETLLFRGGMVVEDENRMDLLN